MAPIVNSLARALGSTPENHPKRAGEYLMLNGSHLNLVTAAMFLTGMAANGLVAEDLLRSGSLALPEGLLERLATDKPSAYLLRITRTAPKAVSQSA